MATQLTLNDGSLNSAGALALKTNGTTQAINITTGQQVEFNDGSDSAPSITNTGDTNTGVFFPAADTVGITTGGTERARVDSSGNLGLGVTPSAWALSGSQAVQVKNASLAGYLNNAYLSANVYFDSAGASKYIASAAATQYAQNSGAHYWYVGASGTAGNAITFTQAMTLDASGNLLVGTTSVDSARANFVDSSKTSGCIIRSSAGSTSFTGNLFEGYGARNTTNGSYKLIDVLNGTGTGRFLVLDSGNAQNTNNSYGAISDIKVKENITDATPKLDKLNQVRIVNYNLIGSTQKQIGVIAQELEQVFPAMVEETVDRDAEGNDLGTTTKSVKYSVFVPMLIKAIQEQQAIITQLQADVAALKGQA